MDLESVHSTEGATVEKSPEKRSSERLSAGSKEGDIDDEMDRSISCLEWLMVITGPLVMPLFAPFIVIFGIRTYVARRSGDRSGEMRNKAYFLGLAEWAHRIFIWLLCIAIIFFLLIKFDRFDK